LNVDRLLKGPDSRLFKKVQMRGARTKWSVGVLGLKPITPIFHYSTILVFQGSDIRRSEAIEAQRSRWAFFNSLLNLEL
jgi:hypothetical protein